MPLEREEDVKIVKGLVQKHLHYTRSPRAAWLLTHWEKAQRDFVKVYPHELRRAQEEAHKREAAMAAMKDAIEELRAQEADEAAKVCAP